MQKVIAKIDLENIQKNAEAFSRLTNRRICAVVKANAYGHGAEEVVSRLENTVAMFAVALIEEGLAIRQAACGKEILVFTPPTDEEEIFSLAVNGFSATVGDFWTAELVKRTVEAYGLHINVHLKINTGMNRYGAELAKLERICECLKASERIKVQGVYSHLAECTIARAEKQRRIFEEGLTVCKRYFSPLNAHLGGSYAALLGEEFLFDTVRVGIGLYGYLPCGVSKETGVTEKTVAFLSLKKGMSVLAKTVASRTCFYGGVGYGGELETGELGKEISVCRFGYADGFLRKRENGLDGYKAHANSLCMDVCLKNGRRARGEYEVILSDAEKTAGLTGTIPYEVLCAATRRAELIYEDETEICGRGRLDREGKEKDLARVCESETGGSG